MLGVAETVAEGFSKIRRSVMPSVLGALEANRRHKSRVSLYEIGKGYLPERGNDKGEPHEVHECAIVLAATPPQKGARFDDHALATALRFVRDHACDSITVDDVVRAIPLSRSVLERRFRKTVGRSVNDEIVRVRLNRAVSLLCETQLELKAIARKSGFGSPSYMGAVFREKLGRTPGSYRAPVRPSSGQLGKEAVPEH